MEPIRRHLRTAFRASGFLALTAGTVYGHRALAYLDPSLHAWAVRRAWVHRWGQAIVRLFGLDLTRVAGELPTGGGPFLVVANHHSPFDILISLQLVGGSVLSHHGVASWPVVGDACRATDTIFVDREDPRSGAKAIRAIRSHLKSGRNVIVFPEGNTFRGDEVRPFRQGVFAAARGLPDVQVLPLGLAYVHGTEFVQEGFGEHLLRTSGRARTPVWLAIGEPRPVPGKGEVEALRRTVQTLVDRAAAARDRQLQARAPGPSLPTPPEASAC
ncbi:MAG: lysophospholipid acyltransferase family protein [Sandaracinaceae bacterium]